MTSTPASWASGCRAPPPTSPAARTLLTWRCATRPAPPAPSARGRRRGARPARPNPAGAAVVVRPGILGETADYIAAVPEIFNYWVQPGRIDVGFLGAAQIDRYGHINTTERRD